MANERKGERSQKEQPRRDAAAGERIQRRRDVEKEMDRREEEGWGQPESSAQKPPYREEEP